MICYPYRPPHGSSRPNFASRSVAMGDRLCDEFLAVSLDKSHSLWYAPSSSSIPGDMNIFQVPTRGYKNTQFLVEVSEATRVSTEAVQGGYNTLEEAMVICRYCFINVVYDLLTSGTVLLNSLWRCFTCRAKSCEGYWSVASQACMQLHHITFCVFGDIWSMTDSVQTPCIYIMYPCKADMRCMLHTHCSLRIVSFASH